MKTVDLSSIIPRDHWWGRVLRAPLALIPEDAVLPVIQGPGRGVRWIVGSSNHGCWLGSYELRQTQMYADQIENGDVVFDIGAHVGWYTLIASRLVGNSGTVVAFEPHAPNRSYMQRHLELNSASNVTLVPVAVCATEGMADFVPGFSRSTGRLSRESTEAIQVRTTSVDSFVAMGPAPAPDVIKIDVEGAEKDVLIGASHTLSTKRPNLFVSTHGPDARRECVELLRSQQFRVRPIDADELDSASVIFAAPVGRPNSSSS